MFQKLFQKCTLLLSVAVIVLSANTANADATTLSNNIQILNKTSDLNIVFGDKSSIGQKTMSFGDYSDGKFQYDYGEGLIKSIFGDFRNITSAADGSNVDSNTLYNAWNSGSGENPDNLVAGIFYGQAYIIKLLQMALLKLTTLILWVYGVLFVGAGFWGLAKNGGNEKSMWGSWGNSSTPFKMLFGLILIFPTTSGYTVGQLLYTQLNLLSNYGGRYIYLSAINLLDSRYIQKGVSTVVKEKLTSNVFNVNGLMKDVIRAEYCTLEMNLRAKNEYPDAESVSSSQAFTFGKSIILLDNQLLLNFGPRPKDDDYNVMDFTKGNETLKSRYQAYSARSGKPVDYCGSIAVPFNSVFNTNSISSVFDSGSASQLVKSESQFVKSLRLNNSVSLMHFFGLVNSTNVAQKFWHDHRGSISNLGEGVYTALAQTVRSMEDSYITTLSQFMDNKGVINLVSANVTTDIGIFWDSSDDVGGKINNALAEYVSKGFTDVRKSQMLYVQNLLKLTKTMNSGNYAENATTIQSKIDGYTDEIVKAMFDPDLKAQLSPYKKIMAYAYNYGWIDAGGWFSTLSNISVGDKLMNSNSPVSTGPNFAFDKVDGDFSRNQHKVTSSAFSLDLAKYNNLNMFLDPATFKASSVSNMASNLLGLQSSGLVVAGEADNYINPFRYEDATQGVFLAKFLGYDPDKPYIHPLMQLKASGERMQNISTYILLGSAVGSFIDFSGSKQQVTAENGQNAMFGDGKSIGGLLSGIIGKTSSLGLMFAVVLGLGGFFLGTYLPMLPTIYWIMGVVTWASGMVINFISIPIVGLIIAFSQTEDFAGRTINFFMALIENALRPLLMPIALLVAIVFQALFVSLGSRLITQAYVVSDLGGISIGILFFVIMYVIINYIILTANAAMIHIIPQEVTKRFNGMASANDESEQINQKISGSLQQSRSDAQAATSVLLRAR